MRYLPLVLAQQFWMGYVSYEYISLNTMLWHSEGPQGGVLSMHDVGCVLAMSLRITDIFMPCWN
jgi:hypothetical protein